MIENVMKTIYYDFKWKFITTYLIPISYKVLHSKLVMS
jgi:hypothetical protein